MFKGFNLITIFYVNNKLQLIKISRDSLIKQIGTELEGINKIE